jgi:hypothetical protein
MLCGRANRNEAVGSRGVRYVSMTGEARGPTGMRPGRLPDNEPNSLQDPKREAHRHHAE